jgi:hypothetical protein
MPAIILCISNISIYMQDKDTKQGLRFMYVKKTNVYVHIIYVCFFSPTSSKFLTFQDRYILINSKKDESFNSLLICSLR